MTTRILCIALALGLHGTCMALFQGARVPPPRQPPPRTTEIEVAVLAPEPPPAALPEPAAPPRPAARSAKPVRPPEPARAAPILTQNTPSAPASEEPVRFVSDPNGTRFGYGVVARGGTAERGEALAAPATTTGPARGEEPIVTRLSRQPVLRAHDGCRGFFPSSAQLDRGEVSLIATVRSNGALARLEVEREEPAGQGFGRAARSCLLAQRFEPALDTAGAQVAARTRIEIEFVR